MKHNKPENTKRMRDPGEVELDDIRERIQEMKNFVKKERDTKGGESPDKRGWNCGSAV